MNISLQVKKIYYKLLRALTIIIISKVTVSVSKYKPLNNIKCFVIIIISKVTVSVSKYKPLNNIVCVIIIIRKVIVSVSKYKPLNNIRYLRNNCFFLQCRLEFVEQL